MNYPITTLMMMDSEIRKAFAARLKELRKQKGWTQKELAARIECNYQQLNKYECGLHTPPLDKLVLLAEVLNTTVDYLATGQQSDAVPLHNTRLLQRFRALEGFEGDDQETVIKLIDAMIAKHQMESTLRKLG